MLTVNECFLSFLSLGRGREAAQWNLCGAQRIRSHPEQVAGLHPEGTGRDSRSGSWEDSAGLPTEARERRPPRSLSAPGDRPALLLRQHHLGAREGTDMDGLLQEHASLLRVLPRASFSPFSQRLSRGQRCSGRFSLSVSLTVPTLFWKVWCPGQSDHLNWKYAIHSTVMEDLGGNQRLDRIIFIKCDRFFAWMEMQCIFIMTTD
ncbi:uncharacterized protein LOC129560526 [Moschus berezovskii]|uniref:uncharacterized protein LOC129560526 n=1 Tax=Moschus berezovskii TaxID=68408 RepID=UPI002444A7CB|nr:uncharacterized protein LOC129560526 [Moschus berezovskii]